MRKINILFCPRVIVLAFSLVERYEVGRHHIADDFQVREVLSYELANYVIG